MWLSHVLHLKEWVVSHIWINESCRVWRDARSLMMHHLNRMIYSYRTWLIHTNHIYHMIYMTDTWLNHIIYMIQVMNRTIHVMNPEIYVLWSIKWITLYVFCHVSHLDKSRCNIESKESCLTFGRPRNSGLMHIWIEACHGARSPSVMSHVWIRHSCLTFGRPRNSGLRHIWIESCRRLYSTMTWRHKSRC